MIRDTDSIVRFGGSSVTTDGDSDTNAFYGVGFGVGLGKQWDLMADYERYNLDDIEPNVFSVGLRYRF